MASMGPPPPPPTNPSKTAKRPIGLTPSSDHDSDSDPESDSDTATPLAGSPATPRYLPPNPQELASQRLLDQLRSAVVEGYPSAGNYCCGGNVPISSHPHPASQDSSKAPIVSPPIILRYDTISGSASKLHFPPDPEDEKGEGRRSAEFDDLLGSCTTELAAEDDGGKDTRGESRGRSSKLERDRFAVDFHPSDFGILDAIKQVLLPGAKAQGVAQSASEAVKGKGKGKESGNVNDNWSERKEHWGVRAELCQLNVSFITKPTFTKC